MWIAWHPTSFLTSSYLESMQTDLIPLREWSLSLVKGQIKMWKILSLGWVRKVGVSRALLIADTENFASARVPQSHQVCYYVPGFSRKTGVLAILRLPPGQKSTRKPPGIQHTQNSQPRGANRGWRDGSGVEYVLPFQRTQV